MWIEDHRGNLHNTDHLVYVYKEQNLAQGLVYVKANDVHDDDYILSVHRSDANAEHVVQELKKQLDEEDKCRKTSRNSKSG